MKLLLKDSYLKVIRNSIGSKIFKNLYFKGSRRIDILRNGRFSCAVFVSWILKIFDLIKEGHATVDGTLRDLKKSGWYRIKKPKLGAVLVWEPWKFNNSEFHKHIGFYFGNNKAVSTSYRRKGTPIIHHWTYGTKNGKPKRRIIEILWHNNLK